MSEARVDERIRELARRSPNFGFLLDLEPMLVLDGAGAESYVYSDPNAALFKARQFGETLAKRLAADSGTRARGTRQVDLLFALTRDGVVEGSTRRAFDDLRTVGNQAVHGHYGEVRAALDAVRTCFELGAWYHRMVTGDRAATAFVPPPDPTGQPVDAADRADLEALREELRAERDRLAEVKVRLGDKTSRLDSERLAGADAQHLLAQAAAHRDELTALVDQLMARVSEFEQSFAASLRRRRRLSAAEREDFIERARLAARQPRTEPEVREETDRMLRSAGWSVQDPGSVNLWVAAQGVAVREMITATGPADYLLYVGRKLAGVIEAKREGTVLSPVERQSARYAGGLTADQKLVAWRLPFRYETTAVEIHFTNDLDPRPRAREVFWFHRP